MKKRVGIVYHWFAHYRAPIIREMAETLGDEYEFEFIADEISLEPAMKVLGADDFATISQSKIAFHRVQNLGVGPFVWQRGTIANALSGRYDVIVFLGEFRILSTWIAIVAARLRGSRTLYWSHGVYGNESWLKLRIRLAFYRLAHAMLLYGNRSRVLMESMGFSQKQLHVVFNSLDYQEQVVQREADHGSRKEFRGEFFPHHPENPVLIFVGRLTKAKRIELLLRVVQQLGENEQPVNLLVVGEGPEQKSLLQLANSLQIEQRVGFFGASHDEETLARLLIHSDVCVSPGNVGLLAVHSMVYGTPVITHRDLSNQGPEVEAIVENRTGGLFDRGDEESLYSKVSEWIETVESRPDQVKRDCHQIIENYYNPAVQCGVLKSAFEKCDALKTPVALDE